MAGVPTERYKPMKAVSGTLPAAPGWAYEIKWDGMRAIVTNGADGIAAHSSELNDITPRFPELRELHGALGPLDVVLDGELVALGPSGLPDFGLLQRRMHVDRAPDVEARRAEVPVVFMVFDVLRVDGTETFALPLNNRRSVLESLLDPGPSWRVSEQQRDDGTELFEAVRHRGMEGIVAKRLSSLYRPGRRSPDWVKVKSRLRQEFVVGGWVSGAGNRDGQIGGLMLGYYDDSGLHLAGRVGSGLSDEESRRLRVQLAELGRDSSPFADTIAPVSGRTVHFVHPEIVVEVAFAEWTSNGNLRHPAYLGQRTDKPPSEVVREPNPASGPAA